MTTDIEALIAEARNSTPTSVVPRSYTSLILRLADALESVAAERDRAIANRKKERVVLVQALGDARAERDALRAAIDEALFGLRASREPDWPGWNVLEGLERILSRATTAEKGTES